MAGRSAKIGITCIVFGILYTPMWWILSNFVLFPMGLNLGFPISAGVLCVPSVLLLIIGLVKFLMDDD